MREAGALIFAVLATIAILSLPFWMTNRGYDVQGMAGGDELTLAKRFVDDLRSRNYADATAITDPEALPADKTIFATLTSAFPKRREDSMRVTAWHKMSMNGAEKTEIEMFYDYGDDGAVRASFTMGRDAASGLKVRGVNFLPLSASQLHANDFHLPTFGFDVRWEFLVIAAAFDLFAFATFAICLLSPTIRWRWRWLWLLFVACGFGRFNLDWSTLQFQFQIVSFMAPPAEFNTVMAYGSWVLSLAPPFGAAIYWAKQVQWRRAHAAENIHPF